MKAQFFKIVTFFWLCISSGVHGHMENHGGDDVDFKELDKEFLFVSLGSYCAPATFLRFCNLRKAAFPFDWMISFNGEKLIEMLDDGFFHFFDDKYFFPLGTFPSPTLLHTYYQLEFVHDGVWGGFNHLKNMELLKSKFERRIERFLKLDEFPGKVFFIRAAFIYSEDPNRHYKYKENIEITAEYAIRLNEALRRRFRNLDFCLIIINTHQEAFVKIEEKIGDNIIMARAPPENVDVMTAAYQQFFNEFLQSEGFPQDVICLQ